MRVGGLDASFGLNGISGNAGELDIKGSQAGQHVQERRAHRQAEFASPLSPEPAPAQRRPVRCVATSTSPIPASPSSLQIPVIGSLNVDLLKDQASTKINAVLEGGKFDLSADISKLRDTPLVNVALAVDTLDLDKLAPPAAAAPAKAPAEGKKDELSPRSRPPRRPPTTISTCRPWSVPASTARSRSASWWCAA